MLLLYLEGNIIIVMDGSKLSLICSGRKRMSALDHNPGGGVDHHGALHPLRLRLGDQAAADGAGA